MKPEIVSQITHVVFHKGCGDGIPAAVLVALACGLDEDKLIPVRYDSPEHAGIEPRPGLCFVDIVPFGERDEDGEYTPAGLAQLAAYARAGAVVLDHHAGVEHVVAMFGERGVYADAARDPGVSGAMLAFREVFKVTHPLPTRSTEAFYNLAVLIGIRDCWLRNDPRFEEASAMSAAVAFIGAEGLLSTIRAGGWPSLIPKLELGPIIRARDIARAKYLLEHAFLSVLPIAHTDGGAVLSVLAFEGGEADASNVADLAAEGAVDLVVAWHQFADGDAPYTTYRLRSRGTFPCKAFAKKNGGGGHERSAGFTVPQRAHEPAHDGLLLRIHKFLGLTSRDILDAGNIPTVEQLIEDLGNSETARDRLQAELDAIRSPLENVDLAALRALHDRVPFPWTATDPHDSHCGHDCAPDGCPEVHPSGRVLVTGPRWDVEQHGIGRLLGEDDADLMAGARNALPRLLQLIGPKAGPVYEVRGRLFYEDADRQGRVELDDGRVVDVDDLLTAVQPLEGFAIQDGGAVRVQVSILAGAAEPKPELPTMRLFNLLSRIPEDAIIDEAYFDQRGDLLSCTVQRRLNAQIMGGVLVGHTVDNSFLTHPRSATALRHAAMWIMRKMIRGDALPLELLRSLHEEVP